MPSQDSAGPEDRLIGQDPRIISRPAGGQLFGRHIKWELLDATAEGRGTVRPVSKGPDSAARGPPARGDSEARSNQKFSHASEAEAVWEASDSRGKARTALVSLGPNAGQLLPKPPRRLIRCMPLHFFLSLTRQGSSLLRDGNKISAASGNKISAS
jgi:hypothetical protein